MLRNSPQGFGKGIISLLIAFTLYTSCSKSYSPDILDDRIALLTRPAGSESWALNIFRVNNTIDTTVKGVIKTYHPDGTLTDNRGLVGVWTLYSRDSLIESTRSSVNPNDPYLTNNFHIDYLDKGTLQLTYTDGDKKINLRYDANQ